MKQIIHPKYYTSTKVVCTCGQTFETGSTLSDIKVEICSNCHPFFTGEMKFVDTQGRVEKFEARRTKAKNSKPKTKKRSQSAQTDTGQDDSPKTLKEMLKQVTKETSSKKTSPSNKSKQ